MRTTLIVPDIQYPYHDALMLRKLISVAEYMQPDQIVQIGDGMDFREISHWNVGEAVSYQPTLQKNIDGYISSVLKPLAEAAPKSKRRWLIGNHDEYLEKFLNKYGVQLRTLRTLSLESLFHLDEHGWQTDRGLTNIAPGTYMLHGHEMSGYSPNIDAWDKKFRDIHGSERSYVFGHTHQPAIKTRSFGAHHALNPRFTMNVGSIMDPKHANYVKHKAPSWVMSFGVLRDDGKRVYPELVTAVDRGFYFEGKKW